jgi:hypothetical protein
MYYIPGQIHEKIQKVNYFKVLCDFNLPLYDGRFDDNSFTSVLEFVGSEVIKLRWFKPEKSQTVYTYIDGYYKDNIYYKIEKECTMSRDFVCINTVIFDDITMSFEREIKINYILNETNGNS